MFARTLIAAAALALSGTAWAQDADHPKDKPLVVGSDFGVAPWMVRGASGPEGFVYHFNKAFAVARKPSSRADERPPGPGS